MIAAKKDLFIFTSAGSYDLSFEYKKEVYKTWDLDIHDNACVKYNFCDKFPYHKYFNFVIDNEGFKFPNFFWFVDKYNILDQYKYFAIIDDDLLFNQHRSFTNIINLMEKYSLDLCSPSCDSKGKNSWYEVMKTREYLSDELWISNFCEMGCMFFGQSLIKKFKEIYTSNNNQIKDYGIDHIICNFVNKNEYKCGIVKNITYYNPLKIDSNTDDCGYKEWKNNIGKSDLAYRVKNIHVKQKITIDKMKTKKKNFLICISSYKRPLQLLGQIHRFNNQSFKDLDISVIVRGCDDFVYDVIKKECGIYNNVFISKAENRDQLNNLLDCIRQVDANNYDYFCKIDDDDIYSIDYIKNIHNKIQSHQNKDKIIGFCNRNPLIVIKEKENSVSIHRTIRGLYGNTLGFDRSVFEILDEISKNKNNIKDILSKLNISIDNPDQYLHNNNIEDKLIDHIMTAIDCDKRIYLDIALDKQLYYCKLSPGIVDIR